MTVDTMRKVDYYAGVPLTFLLTLILKLLSFFRSSKKDPKNILLIELSEMGSTILVDPMMKKAKNEHGANLFFLIFKKNKMSLNILNTVEEKNICTIREDSISALIIDTLKFLFWCRKNSIDTVIDLELFSRFTALLSGASGAANRVGFYSFHNEGLYRGEMLTHKVSYNSHIHISKNFLALLHALYHDEETPYSKVAIKDSDVVLDRVKVSEAERELAYESIKKRYSSFDKEKQRVVLINPNASELLPQRRWMPKKYEELIKKTLENYSDVVVLITGAPSERDEAQSLVEKVGNERCVNFTGGVAFLDLVALYSVSTLMVTNDSGPGHFSAVTDLKVFVIFGPETPALYGSLGNSVPIYAGLACSPCVSAHNHRKTPCSDNVCLQVISVDEVYKLVSEELTA